MRSMTRTNWITFTFAAILTVSSAYADQSDSRLDKMFNQLRTVPDIGNGLIVQAKIWEIWSKTRNDAVSKLIENGRIAMAKSEFQDALGIFDQIIEIAPDFAEGWNKRATVNYLVGDYKESLADIEQTLKLEPRHFGALSGRGLCYLELDNLPKALDAFEAALDINPWLQDARLYVEELNRVLQQQSI